MFSCPEQLKKSSCPLVGPLVGPSESFVKKSLIRYQIVKKTYLPSDSNASSDIIDINDSHCESRKDLRLQGEADLQTPSFRDAEPQIVIPPKTKKNHGVPPVQLRT